jgi:elongation factor Ts
MVEISASLVKELREKTGAGMMDCKKALAENNGNLEESIDWLRKKGLSAAAKKSGRVAAEGLVGIASHGTHGVVVEINAETDFVARNDKFQDLVKKVAELALKEDYTAESLSNASYPGEGSTVSGAITHLISVIGENMGLRRVKRLSVKDGIVSTYMHSAIAPGIGKIGV